MPAHYYKSYMKLPCRLASADVIALHCFNIFYWG